MCVVESRRKDRRMCGGRDRVDVWMYRRRRRRQCPAL